jgi:chemotaxis protein CheD
MADEDAELAQVYLRPGEMHLAREPTIIRTILGSCIGVTFWSQRLGAGALCHSMLPLRPTSGAASMDDVEGYRYVDFCIRSLARKFDELGASRAELQVKVFGGADVLHTGGNDARMTVGRMNCETALKILKAEGLEIIAASMGQTFGRKIRFNTNNGEVLLRRLI